MSHEIQELKRVQRADVYQVNISRCGDHRYCSRVLDMLKQNPPKDPREIGDLLR